MNQDGRMNKEDASGLIMYTKAKPFRQEAIIVLRCLNVFKIIEITTQDSRTE